MALNKILTYSGTTKIIKRTGKVSKIEYSFGTYKKDFWVDVQDIPALFSSKIGEDLIVKGAPQAFKKKKEKKSVTADNISSSK